MDCSTFAKSKGSRIRGEHGTDGGEHGTDGTLTATATRKRPVRHRVAVQGEHLIQADPLRREFSLEHGAEALLNALPLPRCEAGGAEENFVSGVLDWLRLV